ncbi:hypothetical protein DL89DRAFT_165826 [Linderina pennispora]|uniref:Uncharacterized protein n=1 Tax=Linderina pennispora TaxID=61395 RepID=A0A1Y1W8Q7_9FUNG|nr:uncharacterized protein DL89DRAFT_165826 [Linderina pennispora]ORX69785.1 hypothetical protein DL89DRAFT_165826 [Linderina pennispora]
MTMLKCSDISPRQQQLLMQCYCKTMHNTYYYNYVSDEQNVVCTVGDKTTYNGNTTEICANHEKYSDCPGVNISPSTGAHITLSKVALLAVAFSSLLFM